MCLGYFTGLCSAIHVLTAVILVILTSRVMSTQDTRYLHLTWKPNRNFMALESGMSAVCLVFYSLVQTEDCSSLELQVNIFPSKLPAQLLPCKKC